MQSAEPARVVALMGVSGAGKSSLGRAIAARIGLPFVEGDDFHPARNRDRMAAGIALTDEDRWPWLDALGAAVSREADAAGGAILSCSALRRAYRTRLQAAVGQPVLFAFLDVSPSVLRDRLSARTDHFMPASLLDSQLAALDPPEPDEWSVTLRADDPRPALLDALERLIADPPSPRPTAGTR